MKNLKKKIKPLTNKCSKCKKSKVENHHWLCDECYSIKNKEYNKKENTKLLLPIIKRLNPEKYKRMKKEMSQDKLRREVNIS